MLHDAMRALPVQRWLGGAGGVEGGEETALREALVNLGDAVAVNVAEGIPEMGLLFRGQLGDAGEGDGGHRTATRARSVARAAASEAAASEAAAVARAEAAAPEASAA